MIGPFIALALRLGVSQRLSRAAGAGLAILSAILVAGLVLGAVKLWFARHDAAVIGQHETKIQAEIERGARQADGDAFARDAARRAAEREARKEFDDASKNLPDRGLSDRQRLDLCRELRGSRQYEAVRAVCDPLLAGAAPAS